MEEMNALLARRRKAADEKKDGDSQTDDLNSRGQNASDGAKKPWDRANSAERSSLVSRVRPVGSIGDSDALDFDRMKQVQIRAFVMRFSALLLTRVLIHRRSWRKSSGNCTR
ncbi:hypothetical protein PO909_009991 [Leuciscus waleckii]